MITITLLIGLILALVFFLFALLIKRVVMTLTAIALSMTVIFISIVNSTPNIFIVSSMLGITIIEIVMLIAESVRGELV